MHYETLMLTIDAHGVAHVRLNRPEKRNAMSTDMISELTALAADLGANDSVRAIVLGSEGQTFCAGGDLGWMMAQIKADRETRMIEARKLANMLRALNEIPKPVIGRVQGDAFGGGIGMMAVCDCVVAVDTAKFALTETRLGLIPATIGPYVIARMGEGIARRVFMSARVFGAHEALELGMVAKVVSEDALDEAILAEVKPYLSVSTVAVGSAKSMARYLGPCIDDAVIDETIKRLADTWESDDAREGIAAFLEKRPARWAASS